jgi:hypothetical protein
VRTGQSDIGMHRSVFSDLGVTRLG